MVNKVGNARKKVISVIGLGYVGLTTAVGFGLKGYKVIGIDSDEEKVAKINKGISPIYEEGLSEAIQRVELVATCEHREILTSDITFLCVHTPSNADGSTNLEPLRRVAEQVASILREKENYHLGVEEICNSTQDN